MNNKHSEKTLQMVQIAILTAILLVMAFTPLGYLKLGPLSITFMTIPVAISAIMIGPKAALFLGAVFGCTSLFQCFGMDAFGAALLSISPWKCAVMCIAPRLLVGLIPALIYRAGQGKNRTLFSAAACAAAPLTNTVFFLGLLMIFYGNEPYIRQFGDNAWKVLVALGIGNAIPEVIACTLIGTAVCKALMNLRHKKQ